MAGVSAMGLPAAHWGVSAFPREKQRWRSNAVLGVSGMVPCSSDTLEIGRCQEMGAMRGPHQTFSPGTGAGAEHRGVSPPPDPSQEKRLDKSF